MSLESGLGRGDYGIRASALLSGGRCGPCFDRWTVNRVAAMKCREYMGVEDVDTHIRQPAESVLDTSLV